MKIIFAGSGEFGVPTLRSLTRAGHEIVGVFTQPDRPSGRGKKLTPTPVSVAATEFELPLTPTADLNKTLLPPADLMVVIAFGQKISQAAASHSRFGSINLHASRLPKYRGAAPINWAIINGEEQTGNSVIRLAERMDAGAILAQSEVPIGPTETAGELHDRLAQDGPLIVSKVVEDLQAGRAKEQPQDEAAASSAPKLSRQMATLDWNQAADQIARRINGLSPWPGCRVQLVESGGITGPVVTLARAAARASHQQRSAQPGTFLDDGTIAAGSGVVEILELLPEGKRKMSLGDYRRGHRWVGGNSVRSIT